MEGKPIQIVLAKEDHTFELDEEALASIVCQDHVKDKHIAVVSVAGAFRKGKSFLLDFLLRFLKSNVGFSKDLMSYLKLKTQLIWSRVLPTGWVLRIDH